MGISRIGSILVGSILFLSSSWIEAQADNVVAVPKLKGSAKRGTGKVARGIRAQLRDAGYRVLGPSSMRKAGERVGAKPSSLEAAREAEAGLLILGRVKGRRTKTLSVSLIDVSDGSTLETVSKKYRKTKRAKKTGRALLRELLPAIQSYFEKLNRPKPVATKPVLAPQPASEPLVASTEAVDDFAEAEAAAAIYADAENESVSSGVVPKDEVQEDLTPPITARPAAVKVQSAADVKQASSSSEKLNLNLQLEGGALLHKYTVTVDDAATGLHYSLLLPSFGGRIGWRLPSIGIGLAAFGDFQQIRFDLAKVVPPLVPVDPKATMFRAGGELNWQAKISDGFQLRPAIGAEYAVMTLPEQVETVNNTVSSVVLSRSTVRPFLGLTATASLLDNYLDVELAARYLHTISYAESPARTGETSSGMAFDAGLTCRYWLNHWLGVYVSGNYVYSQVVFAGPGDRVTLAQEGQDTAENLQDATAHHSWIHTNLGAQMAF